jgi:hypothetical protein
MLGGTLWVESEFGYGSTFVLSIPVTAPTTTSDTQVDRVVEPSVKGATLCTHLISSGYNKKN